MRRIDLPVSAWLGLGIGAAALLLIVVAAAAVAGLRGIDGELRRQIELIRPRADAATDLQLAVMRLGIAARAQALAPSAERTEVLHAADAGAERALVALEVLPKDPDGAPLFAPVPPLVRTYRARALELAAASGGAASAAEQRLAEAREELLARLDEYGDLQQRKVLDSTGAILRRRAGATTLLTAGLLLALAGLPAVAFVVGRAVRRPVLELVALTRRVADGDYAAAAALSPEPPGRAPRNELAELGIAFGAMAHELDDRDRRIAAQSEELQAQSEELQAQNEELQAQNEELQAQNEEIQAQSQEIQAQQEELRASNDQLRASEEALRDADRRKDEFLAVLSHELRNPLAPIVNGLALLGQSPSAEGRERALGIVERQVRQLVRLIDDLLDVTRITRGKAELRRREADVAAVVRHVAEDHRALLERNGVRLEVDISPPQIAAWTDPERLSQVVANLVQNAAKFTPAGGTVRVECVASGRQLTLRVRDDGEGIPPELLRRLFVPFVQADGSLARTRGGLGLGLALVKGIVELHGGAVRAASDGPGRGSEFVVELPLEQAPRPGRADAPGGRPGGIADPAS